MRQTWTLCIVAALPLVFSCATVPPASQPPPVPAKSDTASVPPPAPAEVKVPEKSGGFNLANLDRATPACNDFYRFANGGWLEKNPIPPAYSRWGNFNILAEKNRDAMKTILEEASRSTAAAGNGQRVGKFYSNCMAEEEIEKAGIGPLAPELTRIDGIKTVADLAAIIARFHQHDVRVPFAFGSLQDARNSTDVVAGASQSGLGLPDRDYYFKDDERSVEIRKEYDLHIRRMFELMGSSAIDAEVAAKTVIMIETRLAAASMTNVELRDPNASYNKKKRADLGRLTPRFPWEKYFTALEVPPFETIIIGQPNFFKEFNSLLVAVPIREWRTYLRWHLVSRAAPLLSSPFVAESFGFRGKFLEGKKEMLPRWRRCVIATDTALGEALGELYVQKAFPPGAKAEALEMVQNLMAALRTNLGSLQWMGPETRKRALAKLEAFATKIGYPDKWRDYSALEVAKGPYLTSVLDASRFEVRRDLSKIGKPLDRTEWYMTPPAVNAYNNPVMNEIVFPAGILQTPFYDPNADDGYNYGGIGAVIGHELIHGFDDEGRQYDAKGNLADWWTEADRNKFDERAACVASQFSSFELTGGLKMKGELVLGESIADLGGLEIALAAYQKSLEGKPRETVDGFTPEQRFFIGWAQVWATNATPEYERLQVTTDPHPLAKFRVNGPLSNIPAFAEAFGCKAGDAMVRPPEQRCDIW